MNATNKLLDLFKKSCSVATDMAAADKLGLKRATVSGWRNDRGHAGPAAVRSLCDGAGEPLEKWLPLIDSERARGPDKAAYAILASRIAKFAAVFAGVYVALHHGLDVHTGEAFLLSPLYIMRNCVGFVTLIGVLVMTLFQRIAATDERLLG